MNTLEIEAANDALAYSPEQLHLWQATTIRSRCQEVLQLAREGKLIAYEFFPERLGRVADFVVQVTRGNYPDLDVPPHSRWRHFAAGGQDRWAQHVIAIAELTGADDSDELQRCATELTIVSVLLDAGAGSAWTFQDSASGKTFSRSEGLGLVSLDLYASGTLSSLSHPYHIDANGLKSLTLAQLGKCFQVSADNPLIGLDSRLQLLHQLGAMIATCPAIFSHEGRLGNLVDYLKALCGDTISIDTAFQELLKILAVIWPERVAGVVPLGDVWEYPGVGIQGGGIEEPGVGLIPFHKLTQWMTYSLTEAWQITGLQTSDEDVLTALAEYRNGGLLLDMGVLKPRDPEFSSQVFDPAAMEVVELRAMTVAVIDELMPMINERLVGLGLNLTLAQILEGGTWAAGRRLAFERDPSGDPPIQYKADGTLF